MKRISLLLAILFCAIFSFAQETEKPKNFKGAEIQFETLTFDFGTLKPGDVKKGSYTFVNVGKKPLILDEVKTSCSCTEIEYPKAPTMPGQKGVIKVTYTADSAGEINKWITVLSNAYTDRVILKTKGRVE